MRYEFMQVPCKRCFGSGDIAVAPSRQSQSEGHGYDLEPCPVCRGDGSLVRRKPPKSLARSAVGPVTTASQLRTAPLFGAAG